MQLTVWTYEGPPHVGAMRIATAMKGVHYVLHAPQGDTYADLLFTMIERRDQRPPVTYTTFQARDLGGDTAELFKTAGARRLRALQAGGDAGRRVLHGRADPGRSGRPGRGARPADPGRAARAAVLPEEGELGRGRDLLPAGARARRAGARRTRRARRPAPRCNILGPTALGFRHRDDVREITRLLAALGVDVNVVAPLGATPADLARLAEADFNVVLYPEIAGTAAQWLKRTHRPAGRRRRCRSASAPRATSSPRSRALAGIDADAVAGDDGVAAALVLALGRFDLPHRQARLHLRRRDPRDRRGAHRQRGARLHGRRPRHLQPRVRARRARRRGRATASRR